jgi:hypothetical protein
MSELHELVFQSDGELQGLLPAKCSLAVSCYEQLEIQHLVATTLQGILESLARTGMDLRALDGMTLTPDCARASAAIQTLPEGQLPLETGDQPDSERLQRAEAIQQDPFPGLLAGERHRPAYCVSSEYLGMADQGSLPQDHLRCSIEEIQVDLVHEGDAKSAESFFRRLLSSTARRIYVGKLDLYFGSIAEAHASLRLLERAGFQLIQHVPIATNEPSDGEVYAVIDAALDLEKIYRQARLSAGRERNARRGGPHGGNRPYGELSGEAAVLERIKRHRDEGLGHSDIAARLNADSVKPRNGKKWYPAVIANILGVRRDAKKRVTLRNDKKARSTNKA